MAIFGLQTGGQIIVLQGLSTYAALASAWFFAKPVLRGQTIAASKTILSAIEPSPDADVNALVKRATEILTKPETEQHALAKRENRWGVVFLIASLAFFTAALGLQIATEPSFHQSRAAPAVPHPAQKP